MPGVLPNQDFRPVQVRRMRQLRDLPPHEEEQGLSLVVVLKPILPQQGIEGVRLSLGPLGLSLVVVVFKTFCPSGIEGKLQSQGTSPGQ